MGSTITMIKYIKSIFSSKPKSKNYQVVKCDNMPSAIGMFCQTDGSLTKFTITNNKEYRTVIPSEITPTHEGLHVKTKKLELFLKEV